jgi:hypothetical protein
VDRGGDACGDRGGEGTSNDGGPPQRSRRRVVAYGGAVTVGAVVVVTDMAFSLGSAAPGAPLTTSTKATARIDTRPGEKCFGLSCRNRWARS